MKSKHIREIKEKKNDSRKISRAHSIFAYNPFTKSLTKATDLHKYLEVFLFLGNYVYINKTHRI